MENIPGKVFETENDGMLMEFATGLREYCWTMTKCEKCLFYCEDRTTHPTSFCKIDYPGNWRI